MHPHDAIQEAVAILWEDLPALLGADWPQVAQRLLVLLRTLDTASRGDDTASNEIIDILGRYPEARRRLVAAMAQLLERQTKGTELARPIEKRQRFTVVPVYYATDRGMTGHQAPERYYGSDRGEMTFGVAEISIPDDHRMGALEKPRWWRLEFRADPEKHVHLLSVQPLQLAAFIDRVGALLPTLAQRDVLMFVHGYNVSFDDALRRTAQIAYDLHFGGVAMLYSWPSAAQKHKYTVDETNIRWAEPHFQEFLSMCVSDLGAGTVHVIAHSMGARLLAETLPALEVGRVAPVAELREIVLAAPDIDTDTFRHLAAKFLGRAGRCTLYASSNDEALALSKAIHGYPRAGDSGDGLVVIKGVDTIDATNVNTGLVGHSYYGENRSILADIFHVVRHAGAPSERFGLLRAEKQGLPYWVFQA